MANQTSLLAHGSIIQARRRHRPLLPIPTMSPCQGRNPATELRPPSDHRARPQKWLKFRVRNQGGPKTELRKWSAFVCNRGEARQYGFTLVRQKSRPENGHQKIAVFSSKQSQKKSTSNPQLRPQALSANRQTAFSTRKTYRREPDVEWKTPEPQQHTEPYKQNRDLKNQ